MTDNPAREVAVNRRQHVYGLDIETDGRDDRLDPDRSRVRRVGVSLAGNDQVFEGREPALLCRVDEFLADLPTGVLATWNGARFDLPFLAARAQLNTLTIGLRLRAEPVHPQPGAPVHRAHRGAWYGHAHLDTWRLFRAGSPGPGLVGPLQDLARWVGLVRPGPDEPDDLRREAEHADAPSDARLARVLTERHWAAANRHLDRLDSPVVTGDRDSGPADAIA